MDNLNPLSIRDNLLDNEYTRKTFTTMASNTMKGTQSFQDTIKAYLETMAENDALFAVKYAYPSKSVSDCCTFIINRCTKAVATASRKMKSSEWQSVTMKKMR